MKRTALILSSLVFCLATMAQAVRSPMDSIYCKPFSHMQVGLSAGSTGVGVDVTASISNNVRLRAGFNVMPKITLNKGYSMTVESSSTQSEEETERRVEHLCECLTDLVGQPVDGVVDMSHELSFYNARLLVDWYPFKKKHWHLTGGFYVGPKSIGKAFNANTESNTMVAINMYNKMYDMVSSLGKYDSPTFKFGNHTYALDPDAGEYMKKAFAIYGRVAVKLGDFPDGTPHYVYPDANGVLQADAETWALKPYVGFGWSTNFGYDKRWTVGFEAGAMFWGKTHVYCNDGVDLIEDVNNIGGKVGEYIDLLKGLPFYPNLEVRLSYTIF